MLESVDDRLLATPEPSPASAGLTVAKALSPKQLGMIQGRDGDL